MKSVCSGSSFCLKPFSSLTQAHSDTALGTVTYMDLSLVDRQTDRHLHINLEVGKNKQINRKKEKKINKQIIYIQIVNTDK